MHLLTALLCCSALVSAAPQFKTRANRVSYDIGIKRLSNEEAKFLDTKCWPEQVKWPLAYTVPPIVNTETRQLSLFFPIPNTKPNTLTVYNYCGYDIHYTHNSPTPGSGVLKAGTSVDRPLTGTVFKASKSPSMANDVLVEFVDAAGLIYYDISLITCLGKTNGLLNSDTSACAGHEVGLQLGANGTMTFQCEAGKWCDDQAYFYHENLCKPAAPVSTCKRSLGLAMEFCARRKK